MAVTASKALTKTTKGTLMFSETTAFTDAERKQIDEEMTRNPQAYEVFQQEAKDVGTAQVMLRHLDNEIREAQRKLRETPEFKSLQDKRNRRKRILAQMNDSTKRAEGALLTVLKGVRKGSDRFELLKGYHNTLQLGKGD